MTKLNNLVFMQLNADLMEKNEEEEHGSAIY